MPRRSLLAMAAASLASFGIPLACGQTVAIGPLASDPKDAGRAPVDLTTSLCAGAFGTEITSFRSPTELPLALTGTWARCTARDGSVAATAVTAKAGLQFGPGYAYPVTDDGTGTYFPNAEDAFAVSVSLVTSTSDDRITPKGYSVLDLTAGGVTTSYVVTYFECPFAFRLTNTTNQADVTTYAPITEPASAKCTADASTSFDASR